MSTDELGWQDQWHRLDRWLERIEVMNSDLSKDTPKPVREDYKDSLLAFFQNCWHLKDWLKNDPSLEAKKELIEEEYRKTKYKSLARCYDLATRAKHFRIDYPQMDTDIKWTLPSLCTRSYERIG